LAFVWKHRDAWHLELDVRLLKENRFCGGFHIGWWSSGEGFHHMLANGRLDYELLQQRWLRVAIEHPEVSTVCFDLTSFRSASPGAKGHGCVYDCVRFSKESQQDSEQVAQALREIDATGSSGAAGSSGVAKGSDAESDALGIGESDPDTEDEVPDELDEDEYEIEAIIEYVPNSKPFKWLVKWAGWDLDREASWSYVHRKDMVTETANKMLLEFERARRLADKDQGKQRRARSSLQAPRSALQAPRLSMVAVADVGALPSPTLPTTKLWKKPAGTSTTRASPFESTSDDMES
jgi:hypothetical protein